MNLHLITFPLEYLVYSTSDGPLSDMALQVENWKAMHLAYDETFLLGVEKYQIW